MVRTLSAAAASRRRAFMVPQKKHGSAIKRSRSQAATPAGVQASDSLFLVFVEFTRSRQVLTGKELTKIKKSEIVDSFKKIYEQTPKRSR